MHTSSVPLPPPKFVIDIPRAYKWDKTTVKQLHIVHLSVYLFKTSCLLMCLSTCPSTLQGINLSLTTSVVPRVYYNSKEIDHSFFNI